MEEFMNEMQMDMMEMWMESIEEYLDEIPADADADWVLFQ